MATVPELKEALLKAHDAGDTEAAQMFADEINSMGNVSLAPRMTQQRQTLANLESEAIETQNIPELQNSGLLSGEDGGAGIIPSLLTATDPMEISTIISGNFPNIGMQQQKAPDGTVYNVLTNNETGAQAVVNKPGISGMDVMQTLGLMAAYTPAGRAATVPMAAAKSGATGAAIEGIQSLSGGEFDPLTPLLDSVLGGAGQKAVELIKATRSATGRSKPVAEENLKDFVSKNFTSRRYKGKSQEDVVQQIIKAAKNNDQKTLAELVDPDASFLQAQKDLGMQEKGLASYSSQNQVFQETEQALKKMPGSKLSMDEADYLTELQQKADDLINNFGGTTEKATLSRELSEDAIKTIDDLSLQADDAYDALAKNIDPKTKVDPTSLKSVIDDEIAALGGRTDELTPLEKSLSSLLDGEVTYRAIDRKRKQVGQAIGKKSGIFKDSGTEELGKWYSLLTEAQESAAPQFSEQWKAAKQLVSQRKALEDNAVKAFGKDLSDAFMPKIGAAVKQLGKGDYKKFDQLLASLPESQRQKVVTSALNDVFTQGSRKEQQLSVAGFADWFNSINREPELKKRIYKNIKPEARKMLNNLGRVTNGVRSAISKAPVGGQVMASSAVMDKIVDGIGSKILAKMPGFVGAAADIFLDKSKSKGTDAAIELLGDPSFVNNIKLLAGEGAKKAENRIMRSNAFKKWAKSLPEAELKSLNTVGIKQYLSNQEEGEQ